MHGRLALSDNRGFTLVELLVVILIIAILAMIALPAFTNQRHEGAGPRRRRRRSAPSPTALATYQTDHDDYDATKAELRGDRAGALPGVAGPRRVSGTDDSYEITETSNSGTDFTLRRTVERPGPSGPAPSPEHGRCRRTRHLVAHAARSSERSSTTSSASVR